MKHHHHPALIARLRRAEGHLRSVITMLEDERPCLDIAQQMHAVEAAIANAKRELIHDHIEHCLEAGEDGAVRRDTLTELKTLSKLL